MILDLEVRGTAPAPLAFSRDAAQKDRARLYSVENLDGEWRVARSATPFAMVSITEELLEAEHQATASNSGGPLVLEKKPQLLGILSGRLNGHDVYVHIKSQRGWIERVLASADPRGDGLCGEP